MNRLGFMACRFAQPFGGSPRGSTEKATQFFRGENAKDAVHDGCLSDAGTARDDEHFARCSQRDSVTLRWSQLKFDPLFDPSESFLDVNRGKWVTAQAKVSYPGRKLGFRLIEGCEIDPVLVANAIPNQATLTDFVLYGGTDDGFIDSQQLACLLDKLILGKRTVPLARQFHQHIAYASLCP